MARASECTRKRSLRRNLSLRKAGQTKMPEKTPKQRLNKQKRLRILVSSSVYGYEELLESTYAILESYGYEVLMSHKGTVPVNPDESALTSCLQAVQDCDIFLGIILPRYGSGIEEPGLTPSLTESLTKQYWQTSLAGSSSTSTLPSPASCSHRIGRRTPKDTISRPSSSII